MFNSNLIFESKIKINLILPLVLGKASALIEVYFSSSSSETKDHFI